MARLFPSCLLALCVVVTPLHDAAAATKKKKATPRPKAKTTQRAATKPAAKKSAAAAKPDAEKMRLLEDDEIPLSARGAIVIDAYTGQPIYEKNADDPLYPASTTKVMTALLVIEAGDLDREVEILPEDDAVGESSLGIKAGERYTRRQMLFGLMLKSANDVAHALGRDNAGTMEAFALKMTQRARELGATRTNFRNPHGLHHTEHFTTARDLAIIGRAAMQQPFFRQIVTTRGYRWERPAGDVWELPNRNRLLSEFPECTGGKTGFTNPAQHTLVSAALRNGREVIAAVLHDTRQGKWEDSKLLLTFGFNHPPQPGKSPLRFE